MTQRRENGGSGLPFGLPGEGPGGRDARAAATVHALSIDVEDWFHVLDCAGAPDPSSWPLQPSRVEANTRALLQLLDAYGQRATFFILGWVAEHHPAVVAEIARHGHEIGSHSYGHALVSSQTPAEFARDLDRSLEALHAAGAPRVECFRAPGFSIGPNEAWAFDILASRGMRMDASLFLSRRAHGGWPLARRRPFEIWAPGGARLMEVPVVPFRLAGSELPWTGGGYLRLLPKQALLTLLRRASHADEPAVIYLHPREIDPTQPRMALPAARRFKYYVGLDGVEDKLRAMFTAARFDTLSAVADATAKDPPLVLTRRAA